MERREGEWRGEKANVEERRQMERREGKCRGEKANGDERRQMERRGDDEREKAVRGGEASLFPLENLRTKITRKTKSRP